MKALLVIAMILGLLVNVSAQTAASQEKSFGELQRIVEELRNNPMSSTAAREVRAYEHFLEEYVTEHPDSAEGWYYLGFVSSIGLFRQWAEKAYLKAIELKPDFAEAYFGLAAHYRSPTSCLTGRKTKEEEEIVNKKVNDLLGKGINFQPYFTYSYAQFGDAFRELARYEEAIEAYKKALLVNPGVIRSYESLGDCYEGLESFTEALENYDKAIELYSQFAAGLPDDKEDGNRTKGSAEFQVLALLEKSGNMLQKQKRYQEALSYFKRIVELNFDDSGSHHRLGLFYLSMGDKQAAMDEYRILLTLVEDPKKPQLVRDVTQYAANNLLEKINRH